MAFSSSPPKAQREQKTPNVNMNGPWFGLIDISAYYCFSLASYYESIQMMERYFAGELLASCVLFPVCLFYWALGLWFLYRCHRRAVVNKPIPVNAGSYPEKLETLILGMFAYREVPFQFLRLRYCSESFAMFGAVICYHGQGFKPAELFNPCFIIGCIICVLAFSQRPSRREWQLQQACEYLAKEAQEIREDSRREVHELRHTLKRTTSSRDHDCKLPPLPIAPTLPCQGSTLFHSLSFDVHTCLCERWTTYWKEYYEYRYQFRYLSPSQIWGAPVYELDEVNRHELFSELEAILLALDRRIMDFLFMEERGKYGSQITVKVGEIHAECTRVLDSAKVRLDVVALEDGIETMFGMMAQVYKAELEWQVEREKGGDEF